MASTYGKDLVSYAASPTGRLCPSRNACGGQAAKEIRGPAKSEWARHKQTIRRLYIDEKRPLKDVMDYMETHYTFTAS